MKFDSNNYTFNIEVADSGKVTTLLTKGKYAPKNLKFKFDSYTWNGETSLAIYNRITTTNSLPIVTASGDNLIWG